MPVLMCLKSNSFLHNFMTRWKVAGISEKLLNFVIMEIQMRIK